MKKLIVGIIGILAAFLCALYWLKIPASRGTISAEMRVVTEQHKAMISGAGSKLADNAVKLLQNSPNDWQIINSCNVIAQVTPKRLVEVLATNNPKIICAIGRALNDPQKRKAFLEVVSAEKINKFKSDHQDVSFSYNEPVIWTDALYNGTTSFKTTVSSAWFWF